MTTVSVNAPKTPVTKGSNTVAAATMPNVCKMPGPPAPFVPTPLPNIGRSGISPKGFSQTVKIEGQPVAIRGASFGSVGDVASKGTGGGIVSNNVEGQTKFIAPGSLNVIIEGRNVHLLGDQMLNNCGSGGSPPNAATMMGAVHKPLNISPQKCSHPKLERDPELGKETRTTEQLVQSLLDEADRLEVLAKEKQALALTIQDASERRKAWDAARDTKEGARHKRFEAYVAKETRAQEVSVKVKCLDCGYTVAEFDVVTNGGIYKECKASGAAVSVEQIFKEIACVTSSNIAPPGTKVHAAIPGGERKAALNRFVRPGGRKMTNKGAGFNRLIQEH